MRVLRWFIGDCSGTTRNILSEKEKEGGEFFAKITDKRSKFIAVNAIWTFARSAFVEAIKDTTLSHWLILPSLVRWRYKEDWST
jgi:hypothetical protein